MKLLFADDDSKLHIVVKLWLDKNGIDMDSAFNGQDALSQLQAGAYDGLITDVNMPLVNGIELIQAALRLPNCPALIIMLTSRCDLEQLKEEVDFSRVHIFNKPFSPAKLLELIHKLSADVAAHP